MAGFSFKQTVIGLINLLLFGLPGMVIYLISSDPLYKKWDKIYRSSALLLLLKLLVYCRKYPDSALAYARGNQIKNNALYYQNIKIIREEAKKR